MDAVRKPNLLELAIVLAVLLIAFFIFTLPLERVKKAVVSRVKNDQRNLATGLDSYRIDYGSFPRNPDPMLYGVPGTHEHVFNALPPLSTPVAYVTKSVIPGRSMEGFFRRSTPIRYIHLAPNDPVVAPLVRQSILNDDEQDALFDHGFLLIGAGKDESYRLEEIAIEAGRSRNEVIMADLQAYLVELVRDPNIYDPSNGTYSAGDLLRTRHGIFEPFKVDVANPTLQR